MIIRRRGGAEVVLNSQTEYNRCHIPRLRVEEEEETSKRKAQDMEEMEQIERELEREQMSWETGKTKDRDKERQEIVWRSSDIRERRKGSNKKRREQTMEPERKGKRRKYCLLGEDWGTAPNHSREGEETHSVEREEKGGAAEEGAVAISTPTPCEGGRGGVTIPLKR